MLPSVSPLATTCTRSPLGQLALACTPFKLTLNVTTIVSSARAATMPALITSSATLCFWKVFQMCRCVCNVSSFDVLLPDPANSRSTIYMHPENGHDDISSDIYAKLGTNAS